MFRAHRWRPQTPAAPAGASDADHPFQADVLGGGADHNPEVSRLNNPVPVAVNQLESIPAKRKLHPLALAGPETHPLKTRQALLVGSHTAQHIPDIKLHNLIPVTLTRIGHLHRNPHRIIPVLKSRNLQPRILKSSIAQTVAETVQSGIDPALSSIRPRLAVPSDLGIGLAREIERNLPHSPRECAGQFP